MGGLTPRSACVTARIAAIVAGAAFWLGGLQLAEAEESDDRPTIQERFDTKDGEVFLHAIVNTQIRNDYYDSIGVGADVGTYLNESIGLEARWAWVHSGLNAAAADVKERTGLTPDARPQHMWMLLGARYSIGYGKFVVGDGLLVHFDPQAFGRGGIALAENRVLPTFTAGLSLLTHYKWGLQAKFDLAGSFQLENRRRGVVTSFGFVPTLGIGWSGHFSDIAALFEGGGEGDS